MNELELIQSGIQSIVNEGHDLLQPVACAIVVNQQGLLLQGRSPYLSNWRFPCRIVQEGESSRLAAMRELEEETWLVGKLCQPEQDLSFGPFQGEANVRFGPSQEEKMRFDAPLGFGSARWYLHHNEVIAALPYHCAAGTGFSHRQGGMSISEGLSKLFREAANRAGIDGELSQERAYQWFDHFNAYNMEWRIRLPWRPIITVHVIPFESELVPQGRTNRPLQMPSLTELRWVSLEHLQQSPHGTVGWFRDLLNWYDQEFLERQVHEIGGWFGELSSMPKFITAVAKAAKESGP